jgi:predicted O-methyltransferase YrrM
MQTSESPAQGTHGAALDFNQFLKSARGGVSVTEGLALRRYARECSGGAVVEIGSFRGKSAVALALGLSENARPPELQVVYCVEPHEPFVGFYGGKFGPEDRTEFYRTVLGTGLSDHIALISLPSVQAAKAWNKPIGLLFIDGDHTLAAVRADITAWQPHLLPGARVIFDDAADPRAGPFAVVRQLIESGEFRKLEGIGKMVALQRASP